MPKIYTTQDNPYLDLSPALDFGDEIITLLPRGDMNFSTRHSANTIRLGLEDFKPTDYLLMMGDPIGIALTVLIVSRLLPLGASLNLLKWNKQTGVYLPIKLSLEYL